MVLGILDILDDKPKIKLEPWMEEGGGYEFILVTPENITECIDACLNAVNGRFTLDLETTGIDNRVFNGVTQDKIVGVCLSGDGVIGWYIPLRHKVGAEHNVPWGLFDREFRRLMAAVDGGKVRAIFHNGKFDHEFLEFHGGEPYGDWSKAKSWEDTLILAYLRHSRSRRKGLKPLAEAAQDLPNDSITGGPGLGMKMLELSDLFPENHPKDNLDFSLLNPSERGPLVYACSDAICTWLLCELLLPAVISPRDGFNQSQIYRIEKGCVTATRWMERNRLPVSREIVLELIQLGQREWFESVMTVYEAANQILGRDVMPGYYKVLRRDFVPDDPLNLLSEQVSRAKSLEDRYFPNPQGKAETRGASWPLIYDVNAPKQLGEMFDEMGVPGLVRTDKSGQIKTSKDVLEKVIQNAEARFPFMTKIRRFRETNRALSNYLYPMLMDCDPTDGTMRISFNAHKVDTGRFSTPTKGDDNLASSRKKKRMMGWPAVNLQAIPATYDPRRPACMTRLRECIVARPGYYIIAIDFAGEELRLVTNLSRESKWLDEFFRCSGCQRTFPRGDGSKTPPPPPPRCPNCGSDKIGDLHTLTGLNLYGEDALDLPEWKQLRGNAKGVNFALCYGGGGKAVVRATGCDKNEGWRIKNQFDGTYSGLKTWWNGQHRFAHKHGFVQTAFGRRYPLPDIFSADGGFRSKAERNSVNGPIQGSGADIIKIAMALAYRACRDRGWLDLVKMIASMHDELVFEVHESVLEEAIEVITPLMTSNDFIMAQRWPVPLTTDCELGRNWAVKWDLNEMKFREVRFDGDEKVDKPKKPKLDKFDSPTDFDAAMDEFKAKAAAWEAMPHSWPACLRPLFKAPSGQPPSIPLLTLVPPPDDPPDDPPPAPKQTTVDVDVDERDVDHPPQTDKPKPPSGLKQGGIYEHTLQAPLTVMTVVKLAGVIKACKNGGTRILKLKLPSGIPLTGWDKGKDVFINDQQFHWLAQDKGL